MFPQIFASPQRFKGQWPEETIITSIRYHPIVMTKAGTTSIILAALGIAALIWWPWGLRTQLGLVFICLGLIVFVRNWLMWWWSNFFVTDHRLLLIDYLGLFNRRVLEITYDQVANQNHEVRGLFNTMMSIGSIEIHNLAGTNPLVISDLSHPERLSREISQAIHDWQVRQGSQQATAGRPTGAQR